ncbi:MAG: hypothetical protein ACYTEX_28545, partial [Planctomycetota bacterium]
CAKTLESYFNIPMSAKRLWLEYSRSPTAVTHSWGFRIRWYSIGFNLFAYWSPQENLSHHFVKSIVPFCNSAGIAEACQDFGLAEGVWYKIYVGVWYEE